MENIQEIKAPRKKGYLDLDIYFRERLGKDLEGHEQLYINGLIDVENGGRNDKFWILSPEGERLALFKYETYHNDEDYAELIGEEIAKILGIPTAHYDLATFNGEKGVISYNFVKEYDQYYAGFDIITDFYEQKLQNNRELSELYGIDYDKDSINEVTDKLNNLEDVWFILEDKYKDHPDKKRIVKKIVNGLVDKLIYDVLTVNTDDHCDNWGEFDELEEGRMAAPLFDNGHILNLHKNISIERFVTKETLADKNLLFTVDNSNIRKPFEVLRHFIDVSSSEYRDIVQDKINTLRENVEQIPVNIENRTNYPMPRYLKKYVINTINNNLDVADEIVNTNRKGSK